MRKAKLRTLIDPVKHVCGVFQPDFFCDCAEDGTPFNNTHLVYVGGEYLGVIFRDFPGDPWRYNLRGALEPCNKCFAELPEAIAALYQVWELDVKQWQDWINSCRECSEVQDNESEGMEEAA